MSFYSLCEYLKHNLIKAAVVLLKKQFLCYTRIVYKFSWSVAVENFQFTKIAEPANILN